VRVLLEWIQPPTNGARLCLEIITRWMQGSFSRFDDPVLRFGRKLTFP
jgi:hypothetical protein